MGMVIENRQCTTGVMDLNIGTCYWCGDFCYEDDLLGDEEPIHVFTLYSKCDSNIHLLC